MRPYTAPTLRPLGQMADVTRKTGPLRDGDVNEPGEIAGNYPPWLVAYCSPGGAGYGGIICTWLGF